uniref:Uncharacterized protein n=1 Tax=Rhizophora mucronata TaxID=61149 RepID=A0A2P2NRM9_RHIMU
MYVVAYVCLSLSLFLFLKTFFFKAILVRFCQSGTFQGPGTSLYIELCSERWKLKSMLMSIRSLSRVLQTKSDLTFTIASNGAPNIFLWHC